MLASKLQTSISLVYFKILVSNGSCICLTYIEKQMHSQHMPIHIKMRSKISKRPIGLPDVCRLLVYHYISYSNILQFGIGLHWNLLLLSATIASPRGGKSKWTYMSWSAPLLTFKIGFCNWWLLYSSFRHDNKI